jgi:hypothetical protein
MLRLQMSLRNARKASPTLCRAYSYKGLCKVVRLHSPRIGVAIGKKALDVCKNCNCYDKVFAPSVSKDLVDYTDSMCEILPSYFDGSPLVLCGNEVYPKISWWRSVLKFVETHPRVQRAARIMLLKDSLAELVRQEAVFTDWIQSLESQVLAFGSHFALRDSIWQSILQDRWRPAPGTIYMISDWADCGRN